MIPGESCSIMDPILLVVIVSGFIVGILYGLWIKKRHRQE